MSTEINEYVDTTTVGSLKSLFADRFINIANQYFDDFEQNQIKINSLINEQKYLEVSRIAHGLKGNSLNMGSAKLAVCCSSLEDQLKSADINKIKEEYQKLQIVYPVAKEKYLSYISQNNS